jgi:hypothetical protein
VAVAEGDGAVDAPHRGGSGCRGLLWELITGADPCAVHRAANQLFEHYDTSAASGA